MISDPILEGFLRRQYEQGQALAASSDILDLQPLDGDPVCAYVATFHCKGLVRCGGDVVEHEQFNVGIRFPSDYLVQFNTATVLMLLAPFEVFHPNIRAPFICVGDMQPGTTLVDLLHQVYEVISYQNLEMRETNALNLDACVWARANQVRFPLESRPLKRRQAVAS